MPVGHCRMSSLRCSRGRPCKAAHYQTSVRHPGGPVCLPCCHRQWPWQACSAAHGRALHKGLHVGPAPLSGLPIAPVCWRIQWRVLGRVAVRSCGLHTWAIGVRGVRALCRATACAGTPWLRSRPRLLPPSRAAVHMTRRFGPPFSCTVDVRGLHFLLRPCMWLVCPRRGGPAPGTAGRRYWRPQVCFLAVFWSLLP